MTNGPPALFDSHTHLDQYDPKELPGIFLRAREAGVAGVVTAGVTVISSEQCVALARENSGFVWAGVGVHPMESAIDLTDADVERLRELATEPTVVCVSEVGLDHQPGMPGRSTQDRGFRLQLQIAVDADLPVIFHNRDAGMEPLRVLDEELQGRVKMVAHYFQGPADYAQACLDRGIYFSLAKPILRLPELQDLVRDLVPLDRIVLETDAFPQPFKRKRSNWTEPWQVTQVAEKVAELKSVAIEEVATTTSANLARVLGRPIGSTGPA
jgi:TatD DNase family protein